MGDQPNAPGAPRKPLPIIQIDGGRRGADGPTKTANIEMRIGRQPVRLAITVPADPVPVDEVLPVFQQVTNVVVDAAVADEAEDGRHVSCRKGCAACCHQLVPVSVTEAHAIKRLVDRMSEPRQSQVRARFARAAATFAQSGITAYLRRRRDDKYSPPQGLAQSYFDIACPFLEDDTCSIHADRPLACREYLVTTPAENCSNPSAESVRLVLLPASPRRALRAAEMKTPHEGTSWVPLVGALDWAKANPEQMCPRTGPTLLEEFFAHLTRRLEGEAQ
jgi:Fe-S-cluster containining protein